MSNTIFILIIVGIFVLSFIGCVYGFKYQQKYVFKTQMLFYGELYELCVNAKTLEECTNAWNKLTDSCIDEKNRFKISKSHHQRFYELRAYLQGKISLLNKTNTHQTN